MLNSVIRINKKYYPQTLLEQWKYEVKKNKMENIINDDLDPSSSDDETDTDSKIVIVIKRLIVNLIMMNLMNNLLKVNTVF